MPLAAWDPSLRYDEQPSSYIHYELEWKLTLNKRVVAKQTGQDPVPASGGFWKMTLSPELEKLVENGIKQAP